MGQAKQRGTFEERKAESIARQSTLSAELDKLLDSKGKSMLKTYGAKHGLKRLMLFMTMRQMIKH